MELGLPICELWGVSETSCCATCNPADGIKLGTVGPPIRGVELQLADDGELLVRGELIMAGYRNDPERTAEAFDDDWLRTGDVATIDDDGFILSESMAINIYLAKKERSPLCPADPKNEARALQWSLWETDRLDRQLVNYCRHTRDLPEAERRPAVAEEAWKDVEPAFGVLETALTRSQWLAGPAFSVGDLNVAAALYRALSLELGRWPQLQAWLTRCWERPAAKKVRAMREAKG